MLPPNHFLRPLEAVGTGGAQKYRGSGAPNPNQHPNQPLCHAMWAAAIVFDVVAKLCTEATNLLKFCMADSDRLDLALGAGAAAGVGFAAGVGNMYTGSGLFWGWAVALGFKFMGIG